jgi:sec-independent protein translocase protein TatB
VFDVGFSELMVIAVVALIVIGPERLPRVARTLGHLFGKLQRYVNDVKADINREIELDELHKFKSTFEDAARGFENTARDVQSEVAKTEGELNALAQGADPSAPESGGPTTAEGSPSSADSTIPAVSTTPAASTTVAEAVPGEAATQSKSAPDGDAQQHRAA